MMRHFFFSPIINRTNHLHGLRKRGLKMKTMAIFKAFFEEGFWKVVMPLFSVALYAAIFLRNCKVMPMVQFFEVFRKGFISQIRRKAGLCSVIEGFSDVGADAVGSWDNWIGFCFIDLLPIDL